MSTSDRVMSSGDKVTAESCGLVFTGVIVSFNPSGLSALLLLTADAGGYPAGAEVPLPVRLLKAAA
jgi:hypothetical protein